MSRLTLELEGVADGMSVRRVSIHERISECFRVVVRFCSAAPDLDVATGTPAVLSLLAGWAHVRGGGARIWTGIVSYFEQSATETAGLSTYELHIVPLSYLLTGNRSYRIFQGKNAPAIVEELLDDWGVPHVFRLDREAFPSLEYRTQYGESDFTFLCRVCERAGISFFFEAQPELGSVLVLTDEPALVPLRPGLPLRFEDEPNMAAEAEYVTRMSLRRSGIVPHMRVRDVDFRKPTLSLVGEAMDEGVPSARLVHDSYEPGVMRLLTVHPPPSGVMAPGAKPGRHDPRAGAALAERLRKAAKAQARSATFETNALDLAPGTVFAISNHPHPVLDPESNKLLVTAFSLDAESDKEWRARCEAVWTDPPYKPALRTQRPVVHGLQCAVVTGPPGHEVHTDEHGRVKVRFYWDHEGAEDEHSSCWIRVSQGWTGPGYGLWTVPRVGEEVLVGFLEGNPDEPFIVGRSPNALTPAPYPLPANKTRSVWRSRSTPNGDGFNEISFEDQRGRERVYVQAERDLEGVVKGDERLTVGGNRHRGVGGDEHVGVRGDKRERIDGILHQIIGGAHRAQIGGKASYFIDGDVHLVIGGRLALEVASDVHIKAGGSVVTEGATASMSGAGGFVHATPGGVLIDGGGVLIQKGGAAGVGAGASPDAPTPPVLAGNFIGMPPPKVVRLPVIAQQSAAARFTTGNEEEIIKEAICRCKDEADAQKAAGERCKAQVCVTKQLRAYDDAMGRKSRIKAEVPYDMSTNPPTPIMSRNEPDRATRGCPKGSNIPDVTIVDDGGKAATQDNITKVIEIKFPPDYLKQNQRDAYKLIAGNKPFEVWDPDTANCAERKKEPVKQKVTTEDKVKIAGLTLLLIVLVLDDLVGGEADDAAIPGVAGELGKDLEPILEALRPALTGP